MARISCALRADQTNSIATLSGARRSATDRVWRRQRYCVRIAGPAATLVDHRHAGGCVGATHPHVFSIGRISFENSGAVSCFPTRRAIDERGFWVGRLLRADAELL